MPPLLFLPPPPHPPSTRGTRPRPLGFLTRSRFELLNKVPLGMIPPPVEARPHTSVGFERSSGPSIPLQFRLTYVQLLFLCAVLLFCMLLHVVRTLCLSRADPSSTSPSCAFTVGGKQLCEPQEEGHLSEKSMLQPSPANAPGRGWWWVDALLGRDTEEDEAVSDVARSMVIQTQQQLVWPLPSDHELRGYKNSIPFNHQRQQRPPISMAKLIMSRHVRPSHPI